MRVILIVIGDEGELEVRENGATTGQLCWDEMLGQITELTHPQIKRGRYPMHTEQEWEDRRLAMERRYNQRQDEDMVPY